MESDASSIIYKHLARIFHFICIASTICLVIWCLIVYVQNNDISRVDFEKFHSDVSDIYPSFSLCFGDVLLSNKLAKHGVNKSYYLDFLKGNFWEKRLIDIDYNDVSVNLVDYLLGIEMYQENFNGEIVSNSYYLLDYTKDTILTSKKMKMKPSFYQDSNPFFGLIQKCLTVDVPYSHQKQLSWLTIVMNKSVFVSDRRPFNTRQSSDMFSVNIHYPNQRYRYSKTKRDWNAVEPASTSQGQPTDLMNIRSYGMKFYVFGMEVIQKRNTKIRPCNDGKTIDDDIIKSTMIRNITCTPPYWIKPNSKTTSDCSNSDELNRFYQMEIRSYSGPCRRMTQITYLYSEYVSDYYHGKLENLKESQDVFFVSLMFPDSRFKEIEMLREISMQSLIGNAGGYIGICVGYSILQFPALVIMIYSKIKSFTFFTQKSSSYDGKVSVFVTPK